MCVVRCSLLQLAGWLLDFPNLVESAIDLIAICSNARAAAPYVQQ
jgi:hypothetical protein